MDWIPGLLRRVNTPPSPSSSEGRQYQRDLKEIDMTAKMVESTLELEAELDAAGNKLVVAEFYARW